MPAPALLPSTTFGDLLRQLRRRAGMTQADLAAAVGFSEGQISRLEKNQRLPNLDVIAQAFIPALSLHDEPRLALQLVQLAALARGETPPAAVSIERELRQPPEDAGRMRLPLPPTPLLGRERDIELIARRFAGHHGRLMTLTGPPGVGKTRLALAVAAQIQLLYADSACFIPLAAVDDPDLLAPVLAAALGIAESGQKSPRAQVIEFLRRKQILLILDNFEQIAAAAAVVADLLAECPGLHILVTSRAALQLRGEQRYPVPVLPAADASELFIRRAQAIQPDFNPTAGDLAAIEAICQRLDRLPLAIELCAAGIDLFTPPAMLARLRDHRLDLPGEQLADLPAHQQTLRNAIHRSVILLDASERALFPALGVFAGGFDLEAVGAMGADEATLRGLAAKSLVQSLPSADGERRLLLLETLRAYALEQLQAGGAERETRARHAHHFLTLAETAAQQFHTAAQDAWLQRLDREIDNLRAALRFLLENAPDDALRLAAALREFWNLRGFYTEGRSWTSQALAATEGVSSARAGALLTAAQLATAQTDFAVAAPLIEACLAAYRQLGDARGEALALNQAGSLARGMQDFALAQARLTESLRIFRRLDDKAQIALTLTTLLHVLTLLSASADEMRPLFQESAALFTELGRPDELAHVTVRRGTIEMLAGNYATAEQLLAESAALFRKLGDQRELAWALEEWGECCWLQGDSEAASLHFREAESLFQALGDKLGAEIILHHFGQIHSAAGDPLAAGRSFRQSLALSQARDDPKMIARNLAGLGGVLLAQGQPEPATLLFAVAQTLFDALPPFLSPTDIAAYARMMAAARAALGPEAFALAWRRGQAMTAEQAIALVDGKLTTMLLIWPNTSAW